MKASLKGKFTTRNAGKLSAASFTWAGYCLGTGFLPAAGMGALIGVVFYGVKCLRDEEE